jgi:hypothetical protein
VNSHTRGASPICLGLAWLSPSASGTQIARRMFPSSYPVQQGSAPLTQGGQQENTASMIPELHSGHT